MRKVLVYDLHASESGALSILMDLYDDVARQKHENALWHFIVSTPLLNSTSHITYNRFPWVKKSWFHRFYFEHFKSQKEISDFKPDLLFSLQNFGVKGYKGKQLVYLHLPFILADYRFRIKRDGIRLWLYQNIIKYFIWDSYKNVDMIIVQTEWMKKALASKAKISLGKIRIVYPKINIDSIVQYKDSQDCRKLFFFPATAFAYKNHLLILEACEWLKQQNICDFKIIFTLNVNGKTGYEKRLVDYVNTHNLTNIEFCGMISREQVFNLYSRSVLLFPSLVESFGMPLLEARLSGSIVLAAQTPFAEEILEGYGNGYFYKGDDNRQLALLMKDVIQGQIKYDNNYVTTINKSNSESLLDILKTI